MTQHDLSFQTASRILFGRGVASGAAAEIAVRGRRVFLVHGAGTARSDWLRAALSDAGCVVASFTCPREPDVALVEAGVASARGAEVDVVVALGGGAVIDLGKAVAALVPAVRPMMDHLEVVGQGLPLDNPPLPFVALPTTAGTGAEVTKNAVISVPEARRKVSLRDARMLPDLAVVDPALTDGAPRAVTLASGLDAVTQVIEPFICTRANRLTDALCRDAIPQGLAALVRLMKHEDPDARDDMAWVSLCGGLALANAGLGAVHGLAGPIGGMSSAAHGAVCGVLLPHVLVANAEAEKPHAVARIAEVRGWIAQELGGASDDAPATLAAWAAAQGLPGLGALGLDRADLAAIASAAAESSSMKANPAVLSRQVLEDIMERAF